MRSTSSSRGRLVNRLRRSASVGIVKDYWQHDLRGPVAIPHDRCQCGIPAGNKNRQLSDCCSFRLLRKRQGKGKGIMGQRSHRTFVLGTLAGVVRRDTFKMIAGSVARTAEMCAWRPWCGRSQRKLRLLMRSSAGYAELPGIRRPHSCPWLERGEHGGRKVQGIKVHRVQVLNSEISLQGDFECKLMPSGEPWLCTVMWIAVAGTFVCLIMLYCCTVSDELNNASAVHAATNCSGLLNLRPCSLL